MERAPFMAVVLASGRFGGLLEAFVFAVSWRAVCSEALVFAPDARAYFLLFRQKKVAKEKATPRSAPGVARSLALLGRPGGRRELAYGSNSASRLPPSRLRCSAPPTGARKASQLYRMRQEIYSRGQPQKLGKTENLSASAGFPGPLRGAEQRRVAGGLRLAMSEPQASSGKPPGYPSSAGNRRSRHRPRVAFFFGYFLLGEARRKYARASGAKPGASIRQGHASGAKPGVSEKAARLSGEEGAP